MTKEEAIKALEQTVADTKESLRRIITVMADTDKTINDLMVGVNKTYLELQERMRLVSMSSDLLLTQIELNDTNAKEALEVLKEEEPATEPPAPPVVVIPPIEEPEFRLIFDENTKSVRDAVRMAGGAEFLHPDLMSIQEGHLGKYIRYDQPAGTYNVPQIWPNLPRKLDSMWMKYTIMFSPGFSTRGTAPKVSNSYKICGWGWDTADGRGTLEVSNTTQYVWGANATARANREPVVMPYVVRTEPRIEREWTAGIPVNYYIRVRALGEKSYGCTWWYGMDDEYAVQGSSFIVHLTQGKLPLIDRIMMSLNFNQERSAAQYINVYECTVYDGRKVDNPFGLPI